MEEHINAIKVAITGVIGLLTTLWGWFGWLVVLWVGCMALDYGTGSAAAIRSGSWSSKAARDGIWHKLGAVVAVIVSGILDLMIGAIVDNIPGITLPWDYSVLLCPLVIVWYILTECGSIIENADKLGADIPPWLAGAMAIMREQVDGALDPSDKISKR